MKGRWQIVLRMASLLSLIITISLGNRPMWRTNRRNKRANSCNQGTRCTFMHRVKELANSGRRRKQHIFIYSNWWFQGTVNLKYTFQFVSEMQTVICFNYEFHVPLTVESVRTFLAKTKQLIKLCRPKTRGLRVKTN